MRINNIFSFALIMLKRGFCGLKSGNPAPDGSRLFPGDRFRQSMIVSASFVRLFCTAVLLWFLSPFLLANNIRVQNVVLEPGPAGSNYAMVRFDLAWDNSWRDANNWDAAWVFVKFRKAGDPLWQHAKLNDDGHDDGSGDQCNVVTGRLDPSQPFDSVTNYGVGVFVFRTNIGKGNMSMTNIKLRWNYPQNGLGPFDNVTLSVMAMEMVWVPSGGYSLGDGITGTSARFRNSLTNGTYAVGTDTNTVAMRTTPLEWMLPQKGPHDITTSTNAKTISLSHTPGTASNRVLLVSVAWKCTSGKSASPATISNVTYGGTAMTALGSVQSQQNNRLQLYSMVNPPPETKSLVVTMDSKQDPPVGIVVGAFTYTGVKQSGGIGTPSFNSNKSTTSLSTVVTSTVGDLVCDFSSIDSDGNVTLSLGTGQTLVFEAFSNQALSSSSYEQGAENSTTTSIMISTAKTLIIAGVALKPAVYRNDGIRVDGDVGIKLVTNGITTSTNTGFPTGTKGFYCMKYELSQGQYISFLNKLTYAQQAERTVRAPDNPQWTYVFGSSPTSGSNGNGIIIVSSGSNSSIPAIYGSDMNGDKLPNNDGDGQHMACNFLSWPDVAAYLDWVGLRPMTELEFEKACRGTATPVAQEYAIGSNSVTHNGTGTGPAKAKPRTKDESPQVGNCSSNQGTGNSAEPFRCGAFSDKALGDRNRVLSGATFWGIMEMSGNVWERTVSVDDATGLQFTGKHGDGSLSTVGFANVASWPGLSSFPNGEVTGHTGIGRRGGSFMTLLTSAAELQVSDRTNANTVDAGRHASWGGRGVRSVSN